MLISVVYLICTASFSISAQALSLDVDNDNQKSADIVTANDMMPHLDGHNTFPYIISRFRNIYQPVEHPNKIVKDEMDLDTTELKKQDKEDRFKRAGNGPSLSIINPLDVLRQQFILETVRRQLRESQKQVAENRKFMKAIGKRGIFFRHPQDILHYNPMDFDNI